MTEWQELEQKYYMQTVSRIPVTLVKGEGARVWGDDGKEYLDFVGGWATTGLGHCHPAVVQAIVEQAGTLIQTSNQFYTIPQIQLAELLVKHSCFDRVFLCNSGTEANEGAVKLARKHGRLHLDSAYEVITTLNSFHGRTLAMVAATGQQKFQDTFVPLPDGFVNVDYDNFGAIKKATTKRTCAVMLEPIQGEGGVNVPHENYLQEVHQWCNEQGILLILDEIQTGGGRTGTLFAYEQSAIEPDVITLAKGLGNGVPIGAILAKESASVLDKGDHGSTFGGNPLACAAGFATLKFTVENNIPNHVMQVGGYFLKELEVLKQEFTHITEVRGQGLLLALQFDGGIAQDVLMLCLQKGLLVNAVKPNALRFIPPLIITENDVDEAIGILRESIVEAGRKSTQ